jgi:hypothetical protein
MEFIIEETLIKVGSEFIWLWVVAIEFESKEIIGITISKERNMFIAERIISGLIYIHGPHPVSRDGLLGIHRPVYSKNCLIIFIPVIRKALLK